MVGGELALAIQKLTEQLTHFSLNEFSNDIPVFDGNTSTFKIWIKAIEKCAILNNNETKTPFLAFRYSTGHVSDYILRLLTITPTPNWQQLKTALCERFSEITDSHVQF